MCFAKRRPSFAMTTELPPRPRSPRSGPASTVMLSIRSDTTGSVILGLRQAGAGIGGPTTRLEGWTDNRFHHSRAKFVGDDQGGQEDTTPCLFQLRNGKWRRNRVAILTITA